MAIIRSKSKIDGEPKGRDMQRNVAEQLLGRKVRVGTHFYGVYVGILRGI